MPCILLETGHCTATICRRDRTVSQAFFSCQQPSQEAATSQMCSTFPKLEGMTHPERDLPIIRQRFKADHAAFLSCQGTCRSQSFRQPQAPCQTPNQPGIENVAGTECVDDVPRGECRAMRSFALPLQAICPGLTPGHHQIRLWNTPS